MFGGEEEEDKPKRKLIKLQYTEEEQKAMEAAQKQVQCLPLFLPHIDPQDSLSLRSCQGLRVLKAIRHHYSL